MTARGRSASLPMAGQRSRSRIAQAGFVVRLNLEDDPGCLVDLTDWPGPEPLRREVAAALKAWSQRKDGLRRRGTLAHSLRAARYLLAWAQESDAGGRVHATFRDWRRADLLDFRSALYLSLAPSTAWAAYAQARRLLQNVADLDPDLRRLLHARLGPRPNAQSSPVAFYTAKQVRDLRRKAKSLITKMHVRIAANYALATDPTVRADDPRYARSQALREVLRTGLPASPDGYRALDAWAEYEFTNERGRRYVAAQRGRRTVARKALFPTSEEARAMTIWLATMGEYNLSVITSMPVPTTPGSGVVQLNLDKPRRGATSRFWADVYDGSNARVIVQIVEATDPLRHHLAAAGTPTDRLICWMDKNGRAQVGNPLKGQARRPSEWFPRNEDGETQTVHIRQVRRSGASLPKEPKHHSADTHLAYLRQDPREVQAHQAKAMQAIGTARRNAKAMVRATVVPDDARAPSEKDDAVITACADLLHSPTTGGTCESGFYGFLLCLSCPNAVSAPRHLPAQIATLDILEELRSSLPDIEWQRRFATPWHQLTTLIHEFRSGSEIAAARARITPKDFDTILSALQERAYQ